MSDKHYGLLKCKIGKTDYLIFTYYETVLRMFVYDENTKLGPHLDLFKSLPWNEHVEYSIEEWDERVGMMTGNFEATNVKLKEGQTKVDKILLASKLSQV